MKKRVIIFIIILIAILLLFPIPFRLKDGGSIEFKALLYTVTKYHRLSATSETGYNDGLGIQILGIEVYNNLKDESNNLNLENNHVDEDLIMIDGRLYYNTGKESTIKARCGNLDGNITSNINSNQIPSIDDQSNFEGNYGYQRIGRNNVELYINNKWIVFEAKDTIYVRTYTVENIKQAQKENSYYITLSVFQGQTDTVLLSSLLEELEVGKTYEFELTKKHDSSNEYDSIESIFKNCNIISITETNKVGLDQQQDSIN